MFSRKKKITATDLGKALLVFVDVFNNQKDESIKSTIENIKKESCLNSSQILFEYWYLRIFTVDFAVYQALGNTDKKSEVLDSFYENIKEWCQENSSRLPHMWDEIKLRLMDYTLSLKAEQEDVLKKFGPGWPVGKEFARYCKIEKEPAKSKITITGNIIFSEFLKTIFKTITSFQIV